MGDAAMPYAKLITAICAGLLSAAPLSAQGSKVSSPLDLAARASALKPGQWVFAPEIAPSGPLIVLVDLTAQLARVYRNGVAIGVSTVSTGKPGHETPTGVFTILQKDAHHHSSKYNSAPMPFQERLTWDGVALHAGGLPGYPESHGCVHLPYAFARELFNLTEMGGTVVITGRAGAPVKVRADDVLAPLAAGGTAVPHVPLPAGTSWRWTEDSPAAGPLSVILSTSDDRIVVLRNGREIGRAAVAHAAELSGTHVATLHSGDGGRPHWVLVGVPGHEGEADAAFDATIFERLQLPAPFLAKLRAAMTPGTSVLVTSARVRAQSSGRQLTLLSATDGNDAR